MRNGWSERKFCAASISGELITVFDTLIDSNDNPEERGKMEICPTSKRPKIASFGQFENSNLFAACELKGEIRSFLGLDGLDDGGAKRKREI